MPKVLVELQDVSTTFKPRRKLFQDKLPPIRAVERVSLTLMEGEILGVIGESGCGKSTLARTILGLQTETAGQIVLDGNIVSGLPARHSRKARRDIQYVHQDPGAALDPWWRVGASLDESLKVGGVADPVERAERIDRMLNAVGLNAGFRSRYPHELSGGQQRRIGLARILGLHPRIVILDEPTSGLDLSVQATVLRLIRDLRNQFGLTYLFISHDLSVVKRMCDRIAIMYLGRIVEVGSAEQIFTNPRHPYTQALLNAAPRLRPGQLEEIEALAGDPPNPARKPSGCAFHTRCPYADERCSQIEPELREVRTGQQAACIRLEAIAQQTARTPELLPEIAR
ncbi:ABC transporter ATP-binding protein [Aliihoeflea sp. 40Bstr573]|uniref:ABC transporter ATP-binding protein n=1 Tax=Aliihoeflea sp. 40Bstr573 TaxID=2696467 RepID=UPI002095FF80|nr:oligopeptide/dipeptide ABC transporter ATP-binding protein [Aliihoeflea sp. 40Bstr573]MCO6386964.1 ATP-binding cassette domain-containing protein [Aliihoeflea sp. 40Bstr573]